ncbi:MAG TPA: hypothetical protein VK141_00195, partial [Nitrosomonas sp.]|nr:hypothetical protein [Nitrosomonas sp.]
MRRIISKLMVTLLTISAFQIYGHVAIARTTYYVSSAGNDANNGTSTATPWKTPMRISLTSYSAGDSILLKRGDTFSGQIHTTLRGESGAPIVIGAYGTGAKPVIYGDLRGVTWIPVAGRPGIYKAYVGANTMMPIASYQFRAGVWVPLTGRLYRGQWAAEFDTFYDNLTEGNIGMSHGLDTMFIHTIGSGAMPISRDSIRIYRRSNYIGAPSSYAIIRDLDVRNFFMAIEIFGNTYIPTGSNNVTVRNISATNCLDGMYMERTTDCLMDSCTSETIGNTQIYLRATTRCRVRYNSVKTTSSIVDGIPCTGDMCGIGVQGSYTASMNTSGYGYNTVEYNSMDNTGTIDFWYNIGDTIRYNTGINMIGGIYPHGTNLVIQGNSMTLKDGASAGGMSAENIGSGVITITGNSFLNARGYGVWLQNTGASIGGTLVFSNNTISGTTSQTNLLWPSGDGIISSANRFIGPGYFKNGSAQNVLYRSLADFHA